MEENKARSLVDALRLRGVDAHLERPSVYAFAVRVALPDGRAAVWDTAPDLQAQVLADGVLVGFVPRLAGSEDFAQEQLVEAIAAADHDRPVGAVREAVPPPGEALPVPGGVFRRLYDGFRG
ncbi:MAG: hypothetical protein H7233_02600 [Pseudorhodobacter sp.]|nr:hypothetical protein [Frankiaceae bacterium]